MTEFNPIAPLFGGALIGLAAVLLMLTEGRIAGVSGILSRLMPPYRDTAFAGRLGFVIGMIVAPLLTMLVTGSPIQQTVSSNLPLMVAAGLLVGFGSGWGNGCTSGHGVCGISRLSPRSLVATLVFMTTGLLTAYILRHLLGA